jgi:transposase-like protein
MIAHAARLAKADARRRLAVADYEGGQRLGAVARAYGVNPRTIIDWAGRFRPEGTPPRRPERKPVEVVIDHDSDRIIGLNHGMGGAMSDRAVRAATTQLGRAIVALQRKRNMPTFTYATGIDA